MMQLIRKVLLYRHLLKEIPVNAISVNCEVSLLAKSDIPRLHEVWPVPLDEMRARLGRGDQCVVVVIGGQMAHYSWMQFSGLHEIRDAGQSLEIQPGHVWVYHCRTADWARGRGIYPLALTRILKESKSRGASAAWIYTSNENVASQRGILKAGFALHKKLSAMKILGRTIPLVSLDRQLTGCK